MPISDRLGYNRVVDNLLIAWAPGAVVTVSWYTVAGSVVRRSEHPAEHPGRCGRQAARLTYLRRAASHGPNSANIEVLKPLGRALTGQLEF